MYVIDISKIKKQKKIKIGNSRVDDLLLFIVF